MNNFKLLCKEFERLDFQLTHLVSSDGISMTIEEMRELFHDNKFAGGHITATQNKIRNLAKPLPQYQIEELYSRHPDIKYYTKTNAMKFMDL